MSAADVTVTDDPSRFATTPAPPAARGTWARDVGDQGLWVALAVPLAIAALAGLPTGIGVGLFRVPILSSLLSSLGYPEAVRQVLFVAIIVAVAAAYTRVTAEN